MLQTVKSELNRRRSSCFPRGQEAHQQRALRDSTVFFARRLDGQLTGRSLRFARPAGGRRAYLV